MLSILVICFPVFPRELVTCAIVFQLCLPGEHEISNLVPRASFPLTSGRKTRALGATISGMRHRCRWAVSRITRIRLFPLFYGACLKWLLPELSFSDRWSRGTKLWERDCEISRWRPYLKPFAASIRLLIGRVNNRLLGRVVQSPVKLTQG